MFSCLKKASTSYRACICLQNGGTLLKVTLIKDSNLDHSSVTPQAPMQVNSTFQYNLSNTNSTNCVLQSRKLTLHNVQFVKYDVTVSFMAQVLDTVTYLVPQVLDTAS